MFDRLGKASAFVASLPTGANRRQTQDISQSRLHQFKDVSAWRSPSEIGKVQSLQPVADKIEQKLIKELTSYFE